MQEDIEANEQRVPFRFLGVVTGLLASADALAQLLGWNFHDYRKQWKTHQRRS